MKLPKGFLAGATSCGIKKSRKLDLGLIYSKVPASVAGVFTKNTIKAAPLKVSIAHINNGIAQAIVVNSGNANCFTGKVGFEDAVSMVKTAADALGIERADCLVASTGIIGRRLPISKIKKGITKIVSNLKAKDLKKVAEAILTTDTHIKVSSKNIKLGNISASVVGIAKGAGMIAPDMKSATMLCFIMTDTNISALVLEDVLEEAVERSFNAITVDGCMSTNDMVLVLANGLAKNRMIAQASNNFLKFKEAVNAITFDLAKQIVKDAEGATKFIEIKICGAYTEAEAKKAAFAIANSVLFKTAMYGANPNWGRIVSVVGQSGVSLKENCIKIKSSSLKKKNITISVDLGVGFKRAVVYTSDLTPQYVKINAAYS